MLQKALVLVFVFAGIAGCIGCGTSSHFVYATIPAASQLAVYREDPYSGELTELSGTPYTVGDGAVSLVIHPSGKFMYVANPGQGEDDISLFDIASNGTLTEVPPRASVAPLASYPELLVMDAAGNYLYVANESDNVSVFSIDSSTGALTQVPGSPFSVGGLTPLNMQLTPSGNFLYVSAAGGQEGSLGSIIAFSVNAGALQLLPSPLTLTSTNGVDPYGLLIDPSGSYLYVANTQSNSISIFAIGSNGSLTTVPGSPLDDIYNDPVALMLDPKGQYLYVANQGSNNVAAYSISSSTGLPVALTTSTSTFAFSTESNPSFLVEDPNGNYLFVGSRGSGAGIQAFGVTSGNLYPLFTYGVGNTPSSIAVVQ
jgi:6-phosphogluconolactonase